MSSATIRGPKVKFKELVQIMVDADMEVAKRELKAKEIEAACKE